MKKSISILLLASHVMLRGQIAIIGHNLLNNSPIIQTRIFVRTDGVITKSLSTGSRSDFKIELPFGKTHQVIFQNARCPVMYMEVSGMDVPADKTRYLMTYEMNVPFVNKGDEDVDTVVFSQPFYKIRFNGSNRMVDDTSYNAAFESSVIRKTAVNEKDDNHPFYTGRIECSSGLSLEDREMQLLNKNNAVIGTCQLNRFNSFAIAMANAAEIVKIRVRGLPVDSARYSLHSGKKIVSSAISSGGICEFAMSEDKNAELADPNFAYNLGGKLVYSSPREKRFFAGETVYLSNKMHTVVKKAKTNVLGGFVFEDLKPDHTYYIGVDKGKLGPNAKIDILSRDDRYIATLDTFAASRMNLHVQTTQNKLCNRLTVNEGEMKMEIRATIFGDNVNNPIGKLKILLLNDNYEVIDSSVTDNFGTFKFKYLPFLKRFYLSAENTDNALDVFKNILIYSSDDNLIKIMTHQKGSKFTYKPVTADMSHLRDIDLDDPMLEIIKKGTEVSTASALTTGDEKAKVMTGGASKLHVENILFEPNQSYITPQAKEVLKTVISALQTNRKLRVEVGAHTDSKGSAEANLKLSEERAKTVQQFIISSGIDRNRVVAKGYGESVLLNHCDDNHNCSEQEHAQNRRIEFKILEGQHTR